jgi:hypothetical protein
MDTGHTKKKEKSVCMYMFKVLKRIVTCKTRSQHEQADRMRAFQEEKERDQLLRESDSSQLNTTKMAVDTDKFEKMEDSISKFFLAAYKIFNL